MLSVTKLNCFIDDNSLHLIDDLLEKYSFLLPIEDVLEEFNDALLQRLKVWYTNIKNAKSANKSTEEEKEPILPNVAEYYPQFEDIDSAVHLQGEFREAEDYSTNDRRNQDWDTELANNATIMRPLEMCEVPSYVEPTNNKEDEILKFSMKDLLPNNEEPVPEVQCKLYVVDTGRSKGQPIYEHTVNHEEMKIDWNEDNNA